MHEEDSAIPPTLALSTKVEEDFISPLTAVRGALEILRDHPDLALQERQRFIDTALRGCVRLEKGVEELADTVYAAAKRDEAPPPVTVSEPRTIGFEARVSFIDALEIVEVDFADLVFSSAEVVDGFYDVLERLVGASGRKWYFLVNYRGCSVWPEAWIAFAHRGKKVNATLSLGTVRYAEPDETDVPVPNASKLGDSDADFFPSREAALAEIEKMKRA